MIWQKFSPMKTNPMLVLPSPARKPSRGRPTDRPPRAACFPFPVFVSFLIFFSSSLAFSIPIPSLLPSQAEFKENKSFFISFLFGKKISYCIMS